MKKLLALAAAAAFVASPAGLALAQTPAAPSAETQAAEKKPAEKKMPVKSANGTVKSATADSIVVAGKERRKDVEWTFAVDTQTAIKKAGKSITAADLKSGDAVHVRYMDAGGKAVARTISVRSGRMAKKTGPKAADKK